MHARKIGGELRLGLLALLPGINPMLSFLGRGTAASAQGPVLRRGVLHLTTSPHPRSSRIDPDGRPLTKEEKFASLQRRRAQTEGRIGILKRGFLGHPMRAKGFEHRELALAWGVLTHDLWVLARLSLKEVAGSHRRKAA